MTKRERGARRRLLKPMIRECSVTIAGIDPHPPAVAALDVAAVVIPVVAIAAPVAFAGNGSSRAGADDRADRSTSAASDRAADNGAGRTTEQRTAKGVVLGRRLVSRHHDGERQQ